jgi:transcriptional regulator with XRE-family HTH domain
MNERLKKLRNALQLNQIEFSEKIQVGASTLAMWETGARKIKDIHISRICTVFNVSEAWLRFGEGAMYTETNATTFSRFSNEYGLDALEEAILRAYVLLAPDTRRAVSAAIRQIATACMDSDKVVQVLEYDRVSKIIDHELSDQKK